MRELFQKSPEYDCEVFVADYTNERPDGGVAISTTRPTDIGAFHMSVPGDGSVHFLAVNIEEYPAFRKGMQNCEAVLASLAAEDGKKQWVLFLELKYCKDTKIPDYGPKAIDQMDAVRCKLAEAGKIDGRRHTIHFNYCSPNNAAAEPFDGFKETQSGTLARVESQGVIFHARMELTALDGSVIIEPPVEI